MSVLPISVSGPMSRKMFPQAAAPVNTNSVDLALSTPYGGAEDIRVAYYKKRGIGKVVGIPGAVGLGAGISHTVYRVPKSELLTRNEVSKIYKNEEDAMMAAQSAERAAAAVVRQGEMNANVAGIVYSNDPMTKIDIDLPIHLVSLADLGKQIVKQNSSVKQKKLNAALSKMNAEMNAENLKYMKRKGMNMKKHAEHYMNETYSVDDIIEAIRNKFIEEEENKIRETKRMEAKRAFPLIPRGYVNKPSFMTQNQSKEQARLIKEHIARKMPKIEAVLAKLREGMILGFAPPAPKPVEKEENLLRFENLSSINFSKPSANAPAAPVYSDPFEELLAGKGGKRKTRRSRGKKTTRKHKRT
jgi:hypothetical protein